MPKLKRWLRVKRSTPVLTKDLIEKLTKLGASIAGGEFEVYQIINVNPENKEEVTELLEKNGYSIEEIDPT